MEVVIIRPPLIYGALPVGNFDRLIRLIRSRAPLPFAGIRNLRSFVSVYNLVDLLIRCVSHPEAADQTVLVSDDDDVSTADLIREIGKALDLKVNLFSLPPRVLAGLFALGRRQYEYIRLTSSLEIDISSTKRLLDWAPPFSFSSGLSRALRAQYHNE